jgi:CheY-like chemotaxis protein
MKRVLIVDDALELGRFLQAALKTLRPPVESVLVPSAEEAILESSQTAPDLLVADIRLPGISGLELVRKIRNRTPS